MALERDEDAPTKILYQERLEVIAKRLRLVREIMKRLIWDEGHHTFPAFADRFMEAWGNRSNADVMRRRLGEWYEIARSVNPSFVNEMSTPDEIQAWYQKEEDVRGETGTEGQAVEDVRVTDRMTQADRIGRFTLSLQEGTLSENGAVYLQIRFQESVDGDTWHEIPGSESMILPAMVENGDEFTCDPPDAVMPYFRAVFSTVKMAKVTRTPR